MRGVWWFGRMRWGFLSLRDPGTRCPDHPAGRGERCEVVGRVRVGAELWVGFEGVGESRNEVSRGVQPWRFVLSARRSSTRASCVGTYATSAGRT